MRGVTVYRHQHLVGLGVFADVGQRLLHHAVHRELRGIRQLHGFQARFHFDTCAFGIFAGEDLDRGRQSEVGER
ncbi:hypothetical protein D3C72_2234980 [compost metagenome]